MENTAKISQLFTAADGNSLTVYAQLRTNGNLPSSPKEQYQQVTITPSMWAVTVFLETHSDGLAAHIGPLTVRGTAQRGTKAAARKAAYYEALQAIKHAIGDDVGNLGRIEPPLTAAQAKLIETSKVDLDTLQAIVRADQEGKHQTLVVLDLEKNQYGDELLEIGIVTVKLPAKSVTIRHLILEYPDSTFNNKFTDTTPQDFAFGGMQHRGSPIDMLAILQSEVSSAKGSGSTYVVGHTVRQSDIKWLENVKICLDGVGVLDVANVEKAGHHKHQAIGLFRIYEEVYHMKAHAAAHNAGNDAVITACVLAKQLERYAAYDGNWILTALESAKVSSP